MRTSLTRLGTTREAYYNHVDFFHVVHFLESQDAT